MSSQVLDKEYVLIKSYMSNSDYVTEVSSGVDSSVKGGFSGKL